MSKFILKKLEIKNFKLFDEVPFVVNFSGNSFIVFDGPNGYGKTTVFDALELALTGNIRRLLSTENKQQPQDIVVDHKNSGNCHIKLLLTNKESNVDIEILRKLKTNIPNSDKKISRFSELWDLFTIEGDEQVLIQQQTLERMLDSEYLKRDYTMFHYVEQEDTAHFLKSNSEVERAKAISKLFGDTSEVQNKLGKLIDTENLLKNKLKSLLVRKNDLDIHYGFSNSQGELAKERSLTYSKLIPWRINEFAWDEEDLKGLTKELKDEHLSELANIKLIIKHKNEFIRNKEFSDAKNRVEEFRLLIMFQNRLDHYTEFRKLIENIAFVEKSSKYIKDKYIKANFIDELSEKVELKKLFELIGLEHFYGEFTQEYNELVSLRKRNNDSHTIIQELLEVRGHLTEKFKDYSDDEDCFFCGTPFDNREKLNLSIIEKTESLHSLLTDDGKSVAAKQDVFVSKFIKPLVRKTHEYISKHELPDAEYIQKFTIADKDKSKIEKYASWLNKENVEFVDLLFSEKYIPKDTEVLSRVSTLIARIHEKFPMLSESYDEANSGNIFDKLFENTFEKSVVHLSSISVDSVELKMKFVNDAYTNQMSQGFSDYAKIKEQIESLKSNQAQVLSLREKITKKIRSYQKRLIKDVEIPFYIYSGKVLQAHQAGMGNGIFIKDKTGGDELKNIRFVADWDSDHDILNTMSSGQIAAVVISLYLALNKVYQQGLSTICIDDPVQTMDEINMMSLVELLRNEFSDRQILMSTHEDNVSKYFLYKFIKHGFQSKQINLMDRKEYQLKVGT